MDSEWAKGPDQRHIDVHCSRSRVHAVELGVSNAVGKGLAKTRREIVERRHHDDQRHRGDALVKDRGVACVKHGRNRGLRGFHKGRRTPWNAIGDSDFGLSSWVRMWSDSNAAKAIASGRGLGQDQTK